MPTIIDGVTCYTGDECEQIVQEHIEKNIAEMKSSSLHLA